MSLMCCTIGLKFLESLDVKGKVVSGLYIVLPGNNLPKVKADF